MIDLTSEEYRPLYEECKKTHEWSKQEAKRIIAATNHLSQEHLRGPDDGVRDADQDYTDDEEIYRLMSFRLALQAYKGKSLTKAQKHVSS